MAKPKGSGWFAIICGVIFLLVLAGSFWMDVSKLPPEWIMRAWLLFVAAVLIWWGSNRVATGDPDQTIGQDTINFVIGVVGVTIALLALFKHL